ncbi:hypothetical protein ABIC33_004883 [Variovorax sp. 1140]
MSEYPCCGAFCTGEVHFGIWLRLRDCFPRPGLGPAADLLFFASPKKRRQKKGDPTVCVPPLRYGQPAVLDVGGGPQNSLHCVALRQLRPLSLLRLRSSAQPEGSDPRHRFARLLNRLDWPSLRSAADMGQELIRMHFAHRTPDTTRRSNDPRPQRPHRLIPSPAGAAERSKGPYVSPPLWLRRGAQRFADQGSPLFERSEFGRDPAKCEHRRLPRSAAKGSQTVGSPFFCLRFFGEAKKSRSPAGASPGLGKQPNLSE